MKLIPEVKQVIHNLTPKSVIRNQNSQIVPICTSDHLMIFHFSFGLFVLRITPFSCLLISLSLRFKFHMSCHSEPDDRRVKNPCGENQTIFNKGFFTSLSYVQNDSNKTHGNKFPSQPFKLKPMLRRRLLGRAITPCMPQCSRPTPVE